MVSDSRKPTRWRPRFSVRTLVVIVTLVCAYAACWGPTKERGPLDVLRYGYRGRPQVPEATILQRHNMIDDRSACAPLLIAFDTSGNRNNRRPSRVYYFWSFGYVAKLPYERELPPSGPTYTQDDLRALYDNWERIWYLDDRDDVEP